MAHRNASAEKREAICEELARIADEYAAIGQAFRIAAEEDKLEIVIEESDGDEADEEAPPEIEEETEE